MYFRRRAIAKREQGKSTAFIMMVILACWIIYYYFSIDGESPFKSDDVKINYD